MSTGDEVAQEVEEGAGVFFAIVFGGDGEVVADGDLGIGVEGKEDGGVGIAAGGFFIQPGEATEDEIAIFGLVLVRGADPFVDEIVDAERGGAGGGFVGGDDDIAEGDDEAALVVGEGEGPEVAGLVDFEDIGVGAVADGGDGGGGGLCGGGGGEIWRTGNGERGAGAGDPLEGEATGDADWFLGSSVHRFFG